MKVISTEIIEESGIKYEVWTYENGAKMKSIYNKPQPQPQPEMSETEQAIFETQANTEYLITLSELNS